MEQTLELHDGVPLTAEHALPQAPQWATVILVSTSQPVATTPSQLPNPASHDVIAQLPVVHDSTALDRLQATPQAPQFTRLVSAASQPLAVFPSQSPVPAAHEAQAHTPALQEGVPLGHEHACPQVAQWLVLVCVLVSHPLMGLPSQLPNPVLHVGVQTPAVHETVPFGFVHTVPHVPQLLIVEFRSASQPLLKLASQLP
jgi:hypothetical protein